MLSAWRSVQDPRCRGTFALVSACSAPVQDSRAAARANKLSVCVAVQLQALCAVIFFGKFGLSVCSRSCCGSLLSPVTEPLRLAQVRTCVVLVPLFRVFSDFDSGVPCAHRASLKLGVFLPVECPAPIPGRSLPPFPRFPGFPGGCWGGPQSQHGKRGKMELLDTQSGLEGQGSKANSEQHGKGGKRGKMELLDTKSGLEGQGSKANSEQHGKCGKRGKMELLDTQSGLEGQGSKANSEQHGKCGKRGKMELLHVKIGPFPAFHVDFVGPPNTLPETLENLEMVEATCPG